MLRIGPEPTDNEISTINIREDNKRIGILKNPNGKYSLDVSGTINCGALTVNGIRATFDGTNSGLWSISDTDTISYVDGSVGIGTEEPAHELDVSGSVNCSELLVNGTAPTFGGEYVLYDDTYQTSGVSYEEVYANISTTSSGVWDLSDSNTISYTNGNVGIGTTSPSEKLQVNGNVELRNIDSDGDVYLSMFEGEADNGMRLFVDGTDNALQIQGVSTGTATAIMTVERDGNVGIGTTDPAYELDVSGNINIRAPVITGTQGDDQDLGSITFRNNYRIGTGHGTSAAIKCTTKNGAYDDNGSLAFCTGNGASDATVKMIVDEGGNVGIGTTDPAYELDVSGNIYANENIYANGRMYIYDSYLTLDNSVTGATNGIHISMKHKDATHDARALVVHQDTADILQINYGYDFDTVRINNTVFIDGSCGIGLTDPAYELDVLGNIGIRGSGNGIIGQLHGSLVIQSQGNGTGEGLFLENINRSNGDSNISINILTDDGIHFNVFDTTDRMYINETGVGIGTTSILAPLHVAGIFAHNLTHDYGRSYYGYADFAEQSHAYQTGGNSIYAENNVTTSGSFISINGVATSSDERIKNNIIDLEDGACLEQLNLLKPKRYSYKDVVNRGSDPVVGFIAQEVQEIIPSAVQVMSQYIPNIYCLATVNGSILEFASPLDLTVITNGGKIKIYDIQDREHFIDVSSASTTTITLSDSSQITEDMLDENQIFVYGEEVHDFHILKKEMIIPVAVGAIQELDRQLIQLKQEKDALQASHDSLKDEMAELKALLQEKSVI